MSWRMSFVAQRPCVALLMSKHDRALLELLWRWLRGELRADIPLAIPDRPDLQAAVEGFGVHFEHVPFDGQAEPRTLEMSVDDLRRRGPNLERHVRACAVCWQAQDRILLDDTKTVAFA